MAEVLAVETPISSPTVADRVAAEINEVTREFSASLAVPDNHPVVNNDTLDVSSPTAEKETADVGEHSAQHDEQQQPPTTDGNTQNCDNNVTKQYIAPKDFDLLKVIGMGAFGKVLQVRNRHSNKIFAMKVISKRLIKRKISYVQNILAESNILEKVSSHPFIVTMHASFQTREKLFIIMDFCAGGELFLKLGKEGIFMERTAAFYLAEITLALEHLHSVHVLHRDLKPENILLGSDGHCCLTDFGLAKETTGGDSDEDGRARTLCGTMEYMAPEMVARKWYGKGADFWSLGCIAFEMLSGEPPFSSKKGSKELFRKIMSERVRMPDGASAGACKLLKGLLNRAPEKRLGAARGTMFEVGGVGALKQQPFFSGLDWGKLELKEIQPPEDFSVENDEDLRHFHDEFVNMTLPRSVKEMSKLDFLPKRCDSENFRGFSFIGDNFPLPERTASENEHYWNNAEDDGQSLSECASSIFDDNDIGEPPTSPEPEKKKRPPRKKKKKKQEFMPPLEVHCENKATDDVIDGTYDKQNGANEKVWEKTNSQPKDEAKPEAVSDTKAKPMDTQQRTSTEENKPPQVSAPNDSLATTSIFSSNTSLNPNAKVWGAAASTTTEPKLNPTPQTKPTQTTPQLPKATQTKPPATATYAPKPGSWASMAIGKGNSNTAQRAAAQSPAASLIPPPPPTSDSWTTIPAKTRPVSSSMPAANSPNRDWTKYASSPRTKRPTKSTMNMNHIAAPPPLAKSEQQNAWPSLGDKNFPPPPGAKPKEQPTLKAKPVGAWGRAT